MLREEEWARQVVSPKTPRAEHAAWCGYVFSRESTELVRSGLTLTSRRGWEGRGWREELSKPPAPDAAVGSQGPKIPGDGTDAPSTLPTIEGCLLLLLSLGAGDCGGLTESSGFPGAWRAWE